mmetsp:Transcript_9555/g.24592  ORF Transcript_9555/g.24592 Transcript_9555/m.24592 type:complete len:215 (-) Transcript_9555:181-825(-)
MLTCESLEGARVLLPRKLEGLPERYVSSTRACSHIEPAADQAGTDSSPPTCAIPTMRSSALFTHNESRNRNCACPSGSSTPSSARREPPRRKTASPRPSRANPASRSSGQISPTPLRVLPKTNRTSETKRVVPSAAGAAREVLVGVEVGRLPPWTSCHQQGRSRGPLLTKHFFSSCCRGLGKSLSKGSERKPAHVFFPTPASLKAIVCHMAVGI